jgi:hypothetical protein
VLHCLQAIESYSAALDKLSTCKIPDKMTSSLQHAVSWDLSSVYYTMATLLQDYAPVSSFAQQQVSILAFIWKDISLFLRTVSSLIVDRCKVQYCCQFIAYRSSKWYFAYLL